MKKHQKIIIGLIFASVILFIPGFIIVYPESINVCYTENSILKNCWDYHNTYSWGQPLLILTIFSFLIFLILLFTPKKIFDSWKWFALVYGLLSVLLIIIAPAQGRGIISITKEDMSWTTSIIFAIISIAIILYQLYSLNKQKKTKPNKKSN